MSFACREPRTGDRHGLTLAARHGFHEIARACFGLQLAKELEGASIHGLVVEERKGADLADHLPSEEDVGGRADVIGEGQVLVDDLDPRGAGIERPVEAVFEAIEADRAMGRMEVAGDDLDECRLAGPVVAHKAHDFARRDRQVDTGQSPDGAEILADVGQL